jgi:signal transduction histidine kinase
MARSPFDIVKFRWYFGAAWFVLALAYVLVIRRLTGYGWAFAFEESAVTWVLLLPAIALSFVLPRFYFPANVWYIYVPVISAMVSYCCAWLASYLVPYFLTEGLIDLTDPFFGIRWFIGFMLLFGTFTGSVLWSRSGEKEDASKRQAEINEKMRDAELHKLQHQLQPHFLFNSLNSINALIQIEPDQARSMVQKLSDFLRFTLKRADEQWVSLEHEMEYLGLYLDIEKIRFKHRLDLTIDIHNEAEPHLIPTLILQPIVENAIKFGLYGTTGKVQISLEAVFVNHQIQITITNPFDTDMLPSSGGTGFGLKSVRRRLQLLYNRNDLLQTGHTENIYTTRLIIPVLKHENRRSI